MIYLAQEKVWGVFMLYALKKEMCEYYDFIGYNSEYKENKKTYLLDLQAKINREMDDFYNQKPNMPIVLLKSRMHTLLANSFTPKIFTGCPFYFEMGLKPRDSWGLGKYVASRWFYDRIKNKVFSEHPISKDLENAYSILFDTAKPGTSLDVCRITDSFDPDHHTLGYTLLFELGINGLLKKVAEYKAKVPADSDEYIYYTALEESSNALIFAAERFADQAKKLLPKAKNEADKKYLNMISETAVKIPANPPETFYEGLCMLLFMREAVAGFENIGVSQFGHVDKLLYPLYIKDIENGILTEAEARELVRLWMLYTDMKFDVEHNSWPETSTCIQLGGCDEYGNTVFNKVTEIFIEEHLNAGLINPKLNCRYDKNSPDEYLELIGRVILKGHNNFALINDEIIIKGLVKSGVEQADARCYVSGGCQETMIEGMGHTEGCALYVALPRLLDLFLYYDRGSGFLTPVDKADSFEEFYNKFLACVKQFFDVMIDWRNIRQQYNKQFNYCPALSISQKGCIESGKDYAFGGAKYNYSTIDLVGLGTVVDSLYAVKKLVYDDKKTTLPQLIEILKSDWQGFEDLQKDAVALPKFGMDNIEADELGNRFLGDVTSHIRNKKNERGGKYIPSLFVWYLFKFLSPTLRATPDGRKKGDLMSAGCGHSQLANVKDITAPIRSMQNVDFSACGGGSAVFDVKLPYSTNMTSKHFADFVRACAKFNCPTIQPNFISQEELLDAQKNPEKHKDLMVRICGLSAYFVNLSPSVQKEIIERNVYS